ncbi:MAG: hypothetical protein KJN66_07320, partial [Bacteroidia bacterium]|nr:hypothetical protein [Bacteroidia bacterium]
MKTKLVLTVFLTSLLFFGCSDYVENVQQSKIASKSYGNNGSSEIHRKYPKEQKEVLETFGAIATSINNGAGHGYYGEFMDQLISFHAYGDKFVEFNGGEEFDSAGNEHNERQLLGVDIEEVIQLIPEEGSLKVAVYYGNVANVTLTADF